MLRGRRAASSSRRRAPSGSAAAGAESSCGGSLTQRRRRGSSSASASASSPRSKQAKSTSAASALKKSQEEVDSDAEELAEAAAAAAAEARAKLGSNAEMTATTEGAADGDDEDGALHEEHRQALLGFSCRRAMFFKRRDRVAVLQRIREDWGTEEAFDGYVRTEVLRLLEKSRRDMLQMRRRAVWQTLAMAASA